MKLIDVVKLKLDLFGAEWMLDDDEHMVEEIVDRQPIIDCTFTLSMRSNMQKPIRLEWMMSDGCDDKGLKPFIIEHRFTGDLNAALYNSLNDMIFYDDGESDAAWIDNEEQGKSWRAWASRPTDEERAAAKWEV